MLKVNVNEGIYVSGGSATLRFIGLCMFVKLLGSDESEQLKRIEIQGFAP
jgi:hypothetical protein